MLTVTSSDPITPHNSHIGWIGTGVMGKSMCTRLLNSGYTLTIYTRTPSKAEPLVLLGATLSPSPSSLASSSHLVFSTVGFPQDVRSVILDPITGALTTLRPGSILIDMTTSDPDLARHIHSSAALRGCYSVDAPVSGGDIGARDGTLSIFAGGDEAVVNRMRPVFEIMGKVTYMGGPGKGHLAKLANQVTIASTMIGLVEGMVFAHRAGIDVSLYLKAISTGAAGSRSLDLYAGRIVKRDFDAGFYVEHFVKDLGICLRECERMSIGLPGLALAQQLYVSLIAHGENRLGTQALILAIERLNNIASETGVPGPS